MGIARKEMGESREYWKAAESIVREIKTWPDYKKDIVISSHGSGFVRHGNTDSDSLADNVLRTDDKTNS